MNGRCHKDALDRAEDICELCGHQFCAQCLLFPRGHRNPPTCKTCALKHSGLRGGSGKHQPISKREYKKRKKELLSQLEEVEEQQPAIEYFELNDPSKFDQSTELDRRIEAIEEEAPIDILAIAEEPPAPVSASPAPNAATPPPPAPPAPADEPADHAMTGLAPVDTSVNPLALGGSPAPAPPPPETSSSAAELLARLKADQPIQSQFASAPMGLDADPFATPTSDLVDPGQQTTTAPASITPPVSLQPPAALDPSPFATAPTAPEPAAARPKSEPWSPPAPPPRGSNLDAMGADQPAASPEPVLPQAAPPAASPFEETPFEEAPFEDFSLSNTVDEQPARRSSDTDESGQWIPPSLRGMAAEDERTTLPKRRS